MEMTRINFNSDWHKRIEVKKGDYGESLVLNYLEKEKNWICYQCISDKAHLFDFLCFNNKFEPCVVEVKTKSHRNKYPDTGFDLRSYKRYKDFNIRTGIRILVLFVDEIEKRIYGNFLDKLDEKRICNNKVYPSDEMDRYGKIIRYYPLVAMEHISNISNDNVSNLQNLKKVG